MLFSSIQRVRGIMVGDAKIGRVFLGNKQMFPSCEKDMD